MYVYYVKKIVKVVDGDTFDLDLDLGFYNTIRVRVRLDGVDTWELYGKNAHPLGANAREFTKVWLGNAFMGGGLVACTRKLSEETPVGDGSFGRWSARMQDSQGRDLGTQLTQAGLTKP